MLDDERDRKDTLRKTSLQQIGPTTLTHAELSKTDQHESRNLDVGTITGTVEIMKTIKINNIKSRIVLGLVFFSVTWNGNIPSK